MTKNGPDLGTSIFVISGKDALASSRWTGRKSADEWPTGGFLREFCQVLGRNGAECRGRGPKRRLPLRTKGGPARQAIAFGVSMRPDACPFTSGWRFEPACVRSVAGLMAARVQAHSTSLARTPRQGRGSLIHAFGGVAILEIAFRPSFRKLGKARSGCTYPNTKQRRGVTDWRRRDRVLETRLAGDPGPVGRVR